MIITLLEMQTGWLYYKQSLGTLESCRNKQQVLKHLHKAFSPGYLVAIDVSSVFLILVE